MHFFLLLLLFTFIIPFVLRGDFFLQNLVFSAGEILMKIAIRFSWFIRTGHEVFHFPYFVFISNSISILGNETRTNVRKQRMNPSLMYVRCSDSPKFPKFFHERTIQMNLSLHSLKSDFTDFLVQSWFWPEKFCKKKKWINKKCTRNLVSMNFIQ